jgi:hypothetical protein
VHNPGIPTGPRDFSYPERPDRLWGPLIPPIQWLLAFFPVVKRPRREGHHSPSPRARLRSNGAAPLRPYGFTAWKRAAFPFFHLFNTEHDFSSQVLIKINTIT